MQTINFPTNTFLKTHSETPNVFSYEAMILVCFNDYCSKLLLSKVFEQDYSLSKKYKYLLSDFEIKTIGEIKEENIEEVIGDRFESVIYSFNLNKVRKKYRGIIEIKSKFISKSTLEDSWFEVEIIISPENDLDISFDYDERSIKVLFSEFLQNFLKSVLSELKKKEIKRFPQQEISQESQSIFSGSITITGELSGEMATFLSDEDFRLNELVVDLYSYILSLQIKNPHLRTLKFDIEKFMEFRGKEKNINSNGSRSGYKKKQKTSVYRNLKILEIFKTISLIPLEKETYAVTLQKVPKEIYEISKKVLEYNPMTQVWQKRLGHYICFYSNEKGISFSIKISTILDFMKDQTTSLKPTQIRENLEKALDCLSEDSIISRWEYKKINEENLKGKNWLEKFGRLSIKINM